MAIEALRVGEAREPGKHVLALTHRQRGKLFGLGSFTSAAVTAAPHLPSTGTSSSAKNARNSLSTVASKWYRVATTSPDPLPVVPTAARGARWFAGELARLPFDSSIEQPEALRDALAARARRLLDCAARRVVARLSA